MKVLVVSIWVLLFLSQPVHAYLDPGSGSMILQVLLGGVAAIAVVLKLFWHRILQVFGIQPKGKDNSKSESPPDSRT